MIFESFILNKKEILRIKKNIFFGINSEFFKIISQILFAPLMIFFWGVDKFGIWIFLISIPSIFTIFNINFNIATINEIIKCKSKKNFKKSNILFNNSIIFIILNSLVFSILIFLFFFLDKIHFNILDGVPKKEIFISLVFIISSIYLNIFEGVFVTAVLSEGKHYLHFNLSTIIDFMSKILTAISGIIFDTLIIPSIIFFSFNLLQFLCHGFLFLRYKKNTYFSTKFFSLKSILYISKLSIGHTASILSNMLKNSGLIFVLGIFFGPSTVGYVSTIKTLFYYFPIRIFGKINNVIYFEIANVIERKNLNKNIKNFINYIRLITILLFLFIFLSLLAGPIIYSFWTNYNYELTYLFLLIIILDTFFYLYKQSITAFLTASNKNIIIEIIDLIILILSILVFYLICLKDISYIYAFAVITLGCFISLVYSYLFVSKHHLLKYKKK